MLTVNSNAKQSFSHTSTSAVAGVTSSSNLVGTFSPKDEEQAMKRRELVKTHVSHPQSVSSKSITAASSQQQ